MCLICSEPIQIPSPIPTLSEWGLIAMAGVLGIIGFMVMRRRKVTA
ncbi:MAG: IPTL-CTERM sorting domain-containing protein [Thermodesulfobacteriales bacterium]|nr:MAG: IPTL-CTERM sorting domain-containing protein [Thermodesulfobacteriales bacterium]